MFFLSLIFFTTQNYSQEFQVSINYLHGEKSKDSHSSREKFSINGYDVTYSIKYSGHRGKNQLDVEKSCVFTEQDITNIKTTITKKGLNANMTLTQESSKSKSFETYCNIVTDITLDGTKYEIRMNGDVTELDDNQSYKDMIFFITLLRKMVKDCN